MGYVAHYGYADGSGEYYISIDTGKCDGCGKCVEVCPQQVFAVILDDYDESVVAVSEDHRKKLRYTCTGCKPVQNRPPLPCLEACARDALRHSW